MAYMLQHTRATRFLECTHRHLRPAVKRITGAKNPLAEGTIMNRWIALFRGINVGGNNILKMAELREDLGSLKFENIRTYVQSGNVVFDSRAKSAASLQNKIASLVNQRHGFKPHVFVLKREDLVTAVDQNPFPEAIEKPSTLHFFFLNASATDPDVDSIEKAKGETERCEITDAVFYLHAPEGVARSKLAANAERYLGVVTTARNYRTVSKLLDLSE